LLKICTLDIEPEGTEIFWTECLFPEN
jgi:hypothetical protein